MLRDVHTLYSYMVQLCHAVPARQLGVPRKVTVLTAPNLQRSQKDIHVAPFMEIQGETYRRQMDSHNVKGLLCAVTLRNIG